MRLLISSFELQSQLLSRFPNAIFYHFLLRVFPFFLLQDAAVFEFHFSMAFQRLGSMFTAVFP